MSVVPEARDEYRAGGAQMNTVPEARDEHRAGGAR